MQVADVDVECSLIVASLKGQVRSALDVHLVEAMAVSTRLFFDPRDHTISITMLIPGTTQALLYLEQRILNMNSRYHR